MLDLQTIDLDAQESSPKNYILPVLREKGEAAEITVQGLSVRSAVGTCFRYQVREALARRPSELIVHLKAETLSSTALGLLLRARATAQRLGVRFTLRADGDAVREMLVTLGVAGVLGLATAA